MFMVSASIPTNFGQGCETRTNIIDVVAETEIKFLVLIVGSRDLVRGLFPAGLGPKIELSSSLIGGPKRRAENPMQATVHREVAMIYAQPGIVSPDLVKG